MRLTAGQAGPFIDSAVKTIQQITGKEVRRWQLSYGALGGSPSDVSIIIGVFGDLVGQVVYSLQNTLAADMVEQLLPDKLPQERVALYLDALGEVARRIAANASEALEQQPGPALHVTTPVIATGSRLSIRLSPTPPFILELLTPSGPLEISLAMEESVPAARRGGGGRGPAGADPDE